MLNYSEIKQYMLANLKEGIAQYYTDRRQIKLYLPGTKEEYIQTSDSKPLQIKYTPDGYVVFILDDRNSKKRNYYIPLLGGVLKESDSLHGLQKYCPYYLSGNHARFVYNLELNKTVEMCIGDPNSVYNTLPLNKNDILHSLSKDSYSSNRYFQTPKFIKDTNSFVKFSSSDSYYYINNLFFSVKQVPLWLNSQPPEFARYLLRAIVSYHMFSKLDYSKELYIGICHQHKSLRIDTDLPTVIFLSRAKVKLSNLSIPLELTQRVEQLLDKYNYYTHNIYFTWYYLPKLSSVDLYKKLESATEEYKAINFN